MDILGRFDYRIGPVEVIVLFMVQTNVTIMN
jgi:hypothetical protein